MAETVKSAVDDRIVRIEAIQEEQAKVQVALTRDVAGLAREMREGFAEVRSDLSKIGKTSWPLIVSMIGLAFVVIQYNDDRSEQRFRPLEDMVRQHVALPGHTEAMKFHAQYTEKFAAGEQKNADQDRAIEKTVESNRHEMELVLKPIVDEINRIRTTVEKQGDSIESIRSDRFNEKDGEKLEQRIKEMLRGGGE
ncbi:MAG: hypothetical protein H6815_00475 [Phycisphaeraceae bacterium]|nr:hypothetical protein [Phycisphaerales bacterium]MCB9858899.1 hypothetical protein [Phycisphaeraceae bacterium]